MKKLFFTSIIFIVLSILIGLYFYNKPVSDLLNAKPDYTISANELTSQYELKENEANKKFTGKVIELQGTIQDISNTSVFTVYLETNNPLATVTCNFDNKLITKELKESYKIGDEISVKGECSGYLMGVVLEKCIIKK